MKRVFIPGSEWLYFKIYTGHKSADEILLKYLYPISEQLVADMVITEYFFIRYTDPYPHLRLRMHVKDVLNYGIIFRLLYAHLYPCMESGNIWNVQCDTYKRELERYGIDTIEYAEKLFCIDSRYILKLLDSLIYIHDAEKFRWRLLLLLIDNTLTTFDLSISDKQDLLGRMSVAYRNEFGFTSSNFTKQLNDKYRINRPLIEDTFDPNGVTLENYYSIITELSNEMKPVCDLISTILSDNLKIKEGFIRSIIHMTCNRLFRSNNRLYEMVLYDFLHRYYQSAIAKLKYSKYSGQNG